MCLLGYTVAVSYNTTDFANTGEAPVLCFWLAIINCVTGLASIASLTAMAVLSYRGIARNEFSQQNRMSRKLEVLLISGGVRGVVIGNLVKPPRPIARLQAVSFARESVIEADI